MQVYIGGCVKWPLLLRSMLKFDKFFLKSFFFSKETAPNCIDAAFKTKEKKVLKSHQQQKPTALFLSIKEWALEFN